MDQINNPAIKEENKNTEKAATGIYGLIQKKINELNVPILDSITKDQLDNFKFFHQRYYNDRFYINQNKQGQYEDLCIRAHTNKLLLLTLASGNDLMLNNKKITEINFFVNNGDRSKIKVVGKRKLGARQTHPETIVCHVKVEGEEEMRNIRAGVTGYLIEINENVKNDPNLLIKDPKHLGYLALIMPKGPIHEDDVNNSHLISEQEYMDILLKRQ